MNIHELDDLLSSGRSIFEMPLSVAYYARVSTEKDEQLNSLDNQKRYYEAFIRANTNWRFAGGYIDEGITGTSAEKREQFQRMISDGKNGAFDLIITKEISRFARNTLDSIRYTRELLRHGVGVYFQNDNINTFDKDAELRLTIMSSIAQDEVRKLSERTRFGFKRAQENSILLGQNNLYGYNKTHGRLEIIACEAAVVREIFERYTTGTLGLRAIANDLDSRGIKGKSGKPLSYSTLYGIIRNPKYKGCYAGRRYMTRDYRDGRTYRLDESKWIVHADEKVPAIVSEEIWEQANRLLTSRGNTMKQHAQSCQNRYAYSGKLICARHGTTFHRHIYKSKRRGEVECWNCRLYRLKGKNAGCNSPTIYSNELDIILEGIFEKILQNKSAVIQEYLRSLKEFTAHTDHRLELNKIACEITALESKKEKLLELTLDGALSNTEFRQRNEQYNTALEQLTQRQIEIMNRMQSAGDETRRMEQLTEMIEIEWKKNHGFSRDLSRVLVDHIVVDADETNTKINLTIYLTDAQVFHAAYIHSKRQNHILSFEELHISQAQVSRLEKAALDRIRSKI